MLYAAMQIPLTLSILVAFVARVDLEYQLGVNNIWKSQNLRAYAMSASQGVVPLPRGIIKVGDEPDHLLVLVHGIMGSYYYDYVHVNPRQNQIEVMQLVKERESLIKISFLSHSLGGLIARYAISVLYTPSPSSAQSDGRHTSSSGNANSMCSSNKGLIAGLEPINFITLATPHLGVRGNKQLPFLLGVNILEKLAAPMAPIFVGRTGSQLFLTDGKPNKPPLLLQMASDCEDGKFLSALGAFRCRIIYANVSYDHMVGWRTSSIRREIELVKPPTRSLDGYKHVVGVESCPPVLSNGPNFPPEAAKAKEAAQNEPSTKNTLEYHEIVEEEMIRGLQQFGWKKVDVNFHSAIWPFFAHNNIHVKNEWLHNSGAGVVAHVADSIKQVDSNPLLAASL
nr:uncharacterized protein LOC109153985 [Ipomoea trifida]